MQHAKFQDHRTSGSGEDFLPYMGMAAILVMWPGPFIKALVPLFQRRLHIKFGFDWPSGFGGEDV